MSDSLGNAADLQTFPNSWDVLRPKAFSFSPQAAASIREHFPVQLHKTWRASIHAGQARRFIWANPQRTALKPQSQSYHKYPYCLLGSTPLALLSRTAVSSRQGLSIAGRLPGSLGSCTVHYGSVPLQERSGRPFLSFLQCFIQSVLGTYSAGHNQGLLCLAWPRSRAVAWPLHAPFHSPCVNLAPLSWSTRVSVVPGGVL